MTFEEHLKNHRGDDGEYDLRAAEDARATEIAEEIEADPKKIEALARKAAQKERASWESKATSTLRKQFVQPALSAELELDLKVPLGDSVAVEYGDMDAKRIRLRKDLRTEIHIAEIRAYETEWTHWTNTEKLLDDGQTIRETLFPGTNICADCGEPYDQPGLVSRCKPRHQRIEDGGTEDPSDA